MKSTLFASLLLSFASAHAVAATKAEESQGRDLITFIKTVSGWEEELPLAGADCAKGVCAFNFATDREDFGVLTESVPFEESLWQGFTTDPNGVWLDEETSLSLNVEELKDGELLNAEQLKALGDSFQKGFKAIDWDIGAILVEQSECRATIHDQVSCALNFETDRESFGVLVFGYISGDRKTIDFIETLTTDPNGVSF